MKKLIPFILVILFGFSAVNCSNDDDRIDYDTYSFVYDIRNVNFQLVNGSYQISRSFINPLYDSDVVLIYRQTGYTSNGSPIWQSLPITYYLAGGHEVDYTFDFSRFDFVIYTGGTFDLGTTPEFILGQSFRIVTVPAQYGKNANSAGVDLTDYESVINYFKIDDSQVTNL